MNNKLNELKQGASQAGTTGKFTGNEKGQIVGGARSPGEESSCCKYRSKEQTTASEPETSR
jgi:hypothetical protein